MKKLFAIVMLLAVTSSASYAATFWTSLKNSFKQDVKATKQAIKTDIKNTTAEQKRAQADQLAAKKKASLKEVNDRLNTLNKEMKAVKADKNISETERTIKMRFIQKQIDFANKQKKDIQKW